MANAAEKAFAIPELLGVVLRDFPPRELLLLQRVNASFKIAIKESAEIQQKLFFKYAPSSNGGTANINPLLRRVFRYLSIDCKIVIGDSDYPFYRTGYERDIRQNAPSKNLRLDTATEQIVMNLYRPIRKPKMKPGEHSSYENMLIANSPVKVVLYRNGGVFSVAVATTNAAPISTLEGLIEAYRPHVVERMGELTLN